MSTKTANKKAKPEKKNELTAADRLKLLYELQQVDSEIDNIRILRGELPLEVQDLEDEVAGLMNVRNNREFDSLSKEIEFQTLEIELCNKKIKEFKSTIEEKNEVIENSTKLLEERASDLKSKKEELDSIIAETQKEEEKLVAQSQDIELKIEPRLLTAYKRIRANARNGLAVVTVQRGACGGCFNKIPPQRQLDIKTHKKIIVCEYCGRILVDEEIAEKK